MLTRIGSARYNPRALLVVLFVTALALGVGAALIGEGELYALVGLLGFGLVMVLLITLGPMVYNLAKIFGTPTLFLAGTLLWSALFDFVIASNTTLWIKSHKGLWVRLQGIGAGTIILPVVVYSILKLTLERKVRRPLLFLEVIPLIWLMWAGFTVIVGLFRGNAAYYLLGDTYRFVLLPVVYWVCVTVITQPNQRRFLYKFMVFSALPITTLTIFNQIYKFAVGSRFMVGKSVDSFALAMSVLLYASSKRKRFRRGALLFAIVLTINSLLSWERRDWLIVPLVWSVSLVLKRWPARYRLARLALTVCVLLLLALLIFYLTSPNLLMKVTNRLKERFDYTFSNEEGLDPSSNRRFIEIEFITQEFRNAPSVALLTGLGQGAEFHDPIAFWKRGSEPGLVHNVHNTYTGVFFRTGAIGVIVVGSFIVLSLRLAYNRIRSALKHSAYLDTIIFQASLIYLIVQFGVVWNVDSNMGGVQEAVIIGLLVSATREQRY